MSDHIWLGIEGCDFMSKKNRVEKEILSALQEEGIEELEQLRDLIFDYHALVQQYQHLHQKFEAVGKPEKLGGGYFCPACHRQSHFGNAFCWNCGKRLEWKRR